MVEEAYLEDICNRTTKSINNTVSGVLRHLKEKYGQLMPHELVEKEDIVKKTIYNPRDPIAIVFSAVKEILEFDDITGTSYKQIQAFNIFYVILQWVGKFGLAIREWYRMLAIQKMWVCFKQFFRTSQRELIETSNITIEDASTNYASMVRNVLAGIQKAL